MSIFGDILGKIFPSTHSAEMARVNESTPATPRSASPTAAAASGAASTTAASAAPVDVEQILSAKAAQVGQPLNWQTSIVDLLKLLGMDSSLNARKALAAELHYTGDTTDTATMNVWLIKQVMSQLAANGGKVPPALMS